MKKNDYDLGNINIDKFRRSVSIVKNLFSYYSERFGFDINLVINDLLIHNFGCGNKVKINVQKQILKNEDNTISVVDFDGATYDYTLSGDHYLCWLQKGCVLKEETVNSETIYKLIKQDDSYEVFDSNGKIIGYYDKDANLIFGYTYTQNLLSSFYTGDNSMSINFTYSNGKITSIDTFDNKNILQMAYSDNVSVSIGNVIYQINNSTDLEVLTKKIDGTIKSRLIEEYVDGVVIVKVYTNEVLTNHIALTKYNGNTVNIKLNDVLRGLEYIYEYDEDGELVCHYEVFENMFNVDYNESYEGNRYYKGDVVINDDVFKGKITSKPIIYTISTSDIAKKMYNCSTVSGEKCSFLFSMWIKGYTNVNVMLECDNYVGELETLYFTGKTEGWSFVRKVVTFVPDQTSNDGFITVKISFFKLLFISTYLLLF